MTGPRLGVLSRGEKGRKMSEKEGKIGKKERRW